MAEPFSMSAIWLTVRDLPRSVAFYRETLGLPLAEELPGMAQFDLGTVRLWLRPAEDGATPMPPAGVALVMSVHAGIEQRCRELEARGVIFSASLAATPLGRMASFPDPDGHLLSLWEPAPGTPALAVPRSAGAARRSEEVLTLLSRAEDAKLLDDYAQAARYYRLIVEAEPEHLAAWGSLSYVLNQQGAYAESLEAGERALALEPELPEVWNNRGNALGALGRPAEALAAFEQATKLAPATVEFIINKALALLNLSRREEALATIDLALALDDGQPVAWSNRGWILAQLGRYQEALDSVEQALGLGLQAAGALDTKGYALAGLGRYEEAITCYDRALAQAPHDAEILAHRAAALRP